MSHRPLQVAAQHTLVRLLMVAVVALAALGAGGYGIAALVLDNTRGKARPTPTPLTISDVNPPVTLAPVRATPTGGATQAGQTVAGVKAATHGCAVKGAEDVKTSSDDFAAPGTAMVTVGALNLRAGPSTECPIVGSLGFGMQVHIAPDLIKAGDYYWRKVATPEGEGYTIASSYQSLPTEQPTSLPVLMYHHIAEGDDTYYVPPDVFEKQVSWLKDHGFVSVTPRDVYNATYKGLTMPAKPIMFTIDDGNPSTMTFKRILDKYGFRGVYFLPNYAQQTDDEIRALDKSGQVCGHTIDHPDLATLSYDDQYAEIVNNKQWLEKILGHAVTCFAYPFGSYNEVTNEIMAASGYKTAYDAWGGPAAMDQSTDRFHLLRYGVYANYSWDTFVEVVRQADGAPS